MFNQSASQGLIFSIMFANLAILLVYRVMEISASVKLNSVWIMDTEFIATPVVRLALDLMNVLFVARKI